MQSPDGAWAGPAHYAAPWGRGMGGGGPALLQVAFRSARISITVRLWMFGRKSRTYCVRLSRVPPPQAALIQRYAQHYAKVFMIGSRATGLAELGREGRGHGRRRTHFSIPELKYFAHSAAGRVWCSSAFLMPLRHGGPVSLTGLLDWSHSLDRSHN